MIEINGITWNHERGYAPLIAASESFSTIYPEVSIHWKKRTLEEFGDYPVSKLADIYDLIMVDHPYSGEAYKHNLFVSLNDYLTEAEIQERRLDSVGQSFDSYIYEDKILALACDAAAQVSAFLPDFLEQAELPKSWDEYISFARKHKTSTPLCPVDMWCVFLSICAQISNKNFFQEDGLNIDVAIQALEKIYEIMAISTNDSLDLNPIQVLDIMSSEGNVVYSPFLFGYTNYSRKSYGKKYIVEFCDVLSTNNLTIALLGGVGIAISAKTKHPDICADFAKFITSASFQEHEYYQYSGQPASKRAWLSSNNNADCTNFFTNTLQTLEQAYVRPRYPNFNVFQESISKTIHTKIKEYISSSKIAQTIQDEFRNTVIMEA